jgi:hypothetical protein
MDNEKARSFVTIMIVIAGSALLIRILIGSFIGYTVSQNESSASLTLKLISAALENYSKDNQGVFPSRFSTLTQSKPPYLDKDYIAASPVKGYLYNCARLEPGGYQCSAYPVNCRLSGTQYFTITTGGILLSEECAVKE